MVCGRATDMMTLIVFHIFLQPVRKPKLPWRRSATCDPPLLKKWPLLIGSRAAADTWGRRDSFATTGRARSVIPWAWLLLASSSTIRTGSRSWRYVTLDEPLNNQHVPPHAIKLAMLFVDADFTEGK